MSSPPTKRVTRSQSRSDTATTHTLSIPETSTTTPASPTSPPPDSHIDLTSDATQPPRPAKQSNKRKRSYFDQTKRSLTHARLQSQPPNPTSRRFDYSLPYPQLNLRTHPHLYRVGVSEQGVLLVQPYKSEILPHWRFATPQAARESSAAIERLWVGYRGAGEFVGEDMCRKFLQMGYTRSRRYANHKSGRKYDGEGRVMELEVDEVKAECAEIFRVVWKRVEADPEYQRQKAEWKKKYG